MTHVAPTSFQTAPLPPSLYADTAIPPVDLDPLTGDATAEVAIVGGGFTGLSTALHLAEQGVSCIVLEANEPGWGASGRNGGQVNPGLKHEPDALEERFGADLGGRMVRLGNDAPGLVFALCARLGIACHARRTGTIRAAPTAAAEAKVRETVRQWAARGADVAWLDAGESRAATGTGHYRGVMLDRRGGNLNPLSYARGLATAARSAGARVCGATPVRSLRREGSGWAAATPRGTVRAGRVVVGTNGYTGPLVPDLAQSIVPVYSGITATEPLPADLAGSIMPSRSSLYEISARYIYYRVDEAGRFLMGGRSVMHDTHAPADYTVLVRHARELFPALESVRWTHCWNGQVAVTTDELPHLHEPEPGLTIALGYNGRGVAMATAVGRMLARRAAGAPAEALDLPLTPIRPMPLHGFWRLGVAAEMAWSAMKERLAG